MKAKELVELLKKLDPETVICKETYDGEIHELGLEASECEFRYFDSEGEYKEGRILILN
jgi:hypothetical protein